jgi:hypothetical protein
MCVRLHLHRRRRRRTRALHLTRWSQSVSGANGVASKQKRGISVNIPVERR